MQDKIILGNLDAKRDWGYAPDYVESMWKMLQQEKAEDFVIATGESHSIRDFLDVAFQYIGIVKWDKYVKQDSRYMRPAEVEVLCGDYSKARELLGWKPKTKFHQLVGRMIEKDVSLLEDK